MMADQMRLRAGVSLEPAIRNAVGRSVSACFGLRTLSASADEAGISNTCPQRRHFARSLASVGET
jgi:hypothetical protein